VYLYLQQAIIHSEFINCYVETQRVPCSFHLMIRQHRLTDLMLIRQMATLTWTVARSCHVLAHVVQFALNCALEIFLRTANWYVTWKQQRRSRT